MARNLTPFWTDGSSEQWRKPGAWETVRIADTEFPGTCRVTGRLSQKIDVKRAPGANGATLTHLGYDPATISLTVRLWTPEHLAEWEILVPFIQPHPKRGRPRPVDVVHPALALHGIKRCYVTTVGLLQPAEPGVMQSTIDVIEWRPATPAEVTTPQGSQNAAAPGTVFQPTPAPSATAVQPTADDLPLPTD